MTVSEDLRGRVAIVSPHLDDAVLSLGASIARSNRVGATITIVSVLAGQASATDPPGKWDERAGFRSAGEAAAARAREDDDACRIVGAKPVRLPFWDRQYARGSTPEVIFQAVVEASGDADAVLLPGYPLTNEDHLWLTTLLLEKELANPRVGLYTEQPYAALTQKAPRTLVGPDRPWVGLAADPDDQLVKLRACRAYASQIPLLGGTPTLLGVLAYETRYGGESVSWIES
ncbi:MAG: hypothetical protein QOH23_1482 [Gaiellaceae bacterium]|nr:hypothetical protein [Gaiellaceae bacterium]